MIGTSAVSGIYAVQEKNFAACGEKKWKTGILGGIAMPQKSATQAPAQQALAAENTRARSARQNLSDCGGQCTGVRQSQLAGMAPKVKKKASQAESGKKNEPVVW